MAYPFLVSHTLLAGSSLRDDSYQQASYLVSPSCTPNASYATSNNLYQGNIHGVSVALLYTFSKRHGCLFIIILYQNEHCPNFIAPLMSDHCI
jgi:hypothetical protein